jgi:hypothetical protein
MTEREFYNKIPEWIEHDWERWNHITCLAYFCHKYEQVNDVKFRLVRSKNGPTLGKEARDFSKLFQMLAPEDYKMMSGDKKKDVRVSVCKEIYNFINWMFDYKFRSGHKSVNGTRIFLVPSIVNEFERMYKSFLAKKDSEDKMGNLISWCNKNAAEIFDSHQIEEVKDLSMLRKYADMYSLGASSIERLVLRKAEEMGLI